MSQRDPGKIPPLGGLWQEIKELLQKPFEEDEWMRQVLRNQAEMIRLLQSIAGEDEGPPQVGDPGDEPDRLDSDEFRYQGSTYVLPRVVPRERIIIVGNQTYDPTRNDVYQDVSDTDLTPGDRETFAEIRVRSSEFLLLEKTAATAATELTYDYFLDDENNPDEDLSGDAPLAEPDEIQNGDVMKDGYLIVDNFVRLEIQNDGNNDVEDVIGVLKGVRMTKK